MRTEKQVVYVPDQLVKDARAKGMTNLSGFVRKRLEEYVKAPASSYHTNAGTADHMGGHDVI